jgi:hypothetical protein
MLCSSDSHVLVLVHPVILKFSRPLCVQSGTDNLKLADIVGTGGGKRRHGYEVITSSNVLQESGFQMNWLL